MSKKDRKNKFVGDSPVYERKPILPKNDKQKSYINSIRNFNIIVGTGVAGSGKSAIAAWIAIDMLDDNLSPIEKIIIARPNQIEGTRSIGLLPGTKNEKMEPWVAPVSNAIKERIGKHRYERLLEQERIELLPLEHIKGLTFNNAFVIIDEAEDIEWSVLKTLLLRTGWDSKIVINGDVRQTSMKATSGLTVLTDFIGRHDNLPIIHIDFPDWSYCVRSKESSLLGELFEHEKL